MNTTALWNERISKLSLLGVGYTALGLDFNKWMYRLRAWTFKKYVPCVNRVLDIGTGTGFYLPLWAEKARSVTPSDISDTVKKLGGVLYDVTEKPLGTFDAVSAMDVLFHIVDDVKYEKAFKHISDMLPVGGYFIFTENMPKNEVRHAHHVSRTGEKIRAILKKNNLYFEKTVPLFHLMNQPVGTDSLWWKFVKKVAPRFGHFLGGILYPIESLLVGLPNNSTKLIIARKFS